ncbi:MAG TPA: hypothetical protein DCW78_07850 [Pseudomonas sp.]|nr:hypothetical protein [Pseudomonas sp.]
MSAAQVMRWVRWTGLLTCSLAALGYLAQGRYDLAGVFASLAVLSWINIRRKCDETGARKE